MRPTHPATTRPRGGGLPAPPLQDPSCSVEAEPIISRLQTPELARPSTCGNAPPRRRTWSWFSVPPRNLPHTRPDRSFGGLPARSLSQCKSREQPQGDQTCATTRTDRSRLARSAVRTRPSPPGAWIPLAPMVVQRRTSSYRVLYPEGPGLNGRPNRQHHERGNDDTNVDCRNLCHRFSAADLRQRSSWRGSR